MLWLIKLSHPFFWVPSLSYLTFLVVSSYFIFLPPLFFGSNVRGEMNGNGVFWFNTGDLYLGEFCCNSLHGCGMLSIMVEDEIDSQTNEVLTWKKEILAGYFCWNEYVGTQPVGGM
jgi:hypothetical protein